jgi:hypothetical protein
MCVSLWSQEFFTKMIESKASRDSQKKFKKIKNAVAVARRKKRQPSRSTPPTTPSSNSERNLHEIRFLKRFERELVGFL